MNLLSSLNHAFHPSLDHAGESLDDSAEKDGSPGGASSKTPSNRPLGFRASEASKWIEGGEADAAKGRRNEEKGRCPVGASRILSSDSRGQGLIAGTRKMSLEINFTFNKLAVSRVRTSVLVL